MKGLKYVNKACGQYFRDAYVNYSRKLKLVMRFVELYKPYMLFKGMYVYFTSMIRDRVLSFNFNYMKDGAKVKSKLNFALTPFITLSI